MKRATIAALAGWIYFAAPILCAAQQPPTSQPAQNPQLELAEERNRLLEAHNAQLLNVLIASLAFSAAFLVAFLGIVGFLTSRRYDRDREALHSVLTSESHEAESRLDATIKAAIANLTAEQSSQASDLRTDVLGRVQSIQESLTASIERTASKSVEPLSDKVRSLREDVLLIQYELCTTEAGRLTGLKSYGAAFTKWFEVARIGKTLGWEWIISNGCEGMENSLRAGGKADHEEIRELTRFLDKLGPDYATIAGRLRTLLGGP